MGFIFDAWLLGEKGFFLCADLADGHLISNPARHRDEAKFLAETGYDPEAPGVVEDGRTTFNATLFGAPHDCRAVVFCGHRVVAALPPGEYYSTRTFYVALIATVLGLVTLAFVLLVRRIDIASGRLQAFYAAEDERRAKEFAIASTIQNSALPGPIPPDAAFALAAAMHPAREVGGDFFDYFRLDATHLAFLVADVSGKGVTAALYMMTSKTLIKDKLAAVRDPAEALTKANAELCANNPANMFLTAWVGVLDLETGVVTYANAGHNPPVTVEGREVDFVTPKSGPVLAFMDGVVYKPFTLRLAPGETLFLYTDGVTEALDASGALFGEDRLHEALVAASGAEPASMCRIVRAAVAAFAEGTPQADDITVLAVRYSGAGEGGGERRSFPATQAGVAAASDFLDEAIAEAEARSPGLGILSPPLHIIIDEIASNIVKHSGAKDFGLRIECLSEPAGARLTFFDAGKPFDPLAHADPDPTLPVTERPIGGLGIMMVRKMADSVEYKRVDDRNCLTVTKLCPEI